MTERDKIIDKIKKCLALSASSNEHEAATALRQARKLMEAHDVSDLDMLAAEAAERRTKSGASAKPSNWEAMLAGKVGMAFGCRVIFSPSFFGGPGQWGFIGCGTAPEVADYAFTVLLRQVKLARGVYIKSRLKRCKLATKTRRADLYCEGWIRSSIGALTAFTGSEQQSAAIDAYIANHHSKLTTLNATDRNAGRNLRDHEYGDYAAGTMHGRNAELNRGVGAEQQRQIGGA